MVQELLIATQATENHRNLFCFKIDGRRVSLEYISEQKYRFHFEEREQNEFTYIEFLFNTKDKDYFYFVDQPNIKREISKTIVGGQEHGPRNLLSQKHLRHFIFRRGLDFSPAVESRRSFFRTRAIQKVLSAVGRWTSFHKTVRQDKGLCICIHSPCYIYTAKPCNKWFFQLSKIMSHGILQE